MRIQLAHSMASAADERTNDSQCNLRLCQLRVYAYQFPDTVLFFLVCLFERDWELIHLSLILWTFHSGWICMQEMQT